ncbi:hypothetical protein HOF92_12155, partial [bacterium]|nr:hypothetical protein [bacterium]
MKIDRKKNRGLSLVEILAATAVLSALLVPVLLIMRYSITATYRSSNDILAASLALSKIEELKSYPFFQLENILLGLNPEDPYRDQNPNAKKFLIGPFETFPETPDLVEENVYRSGPSVFHRYTFLSYFPESNPHPNDPEFEQKKKRIRIRIRIFWKDRLSISVVMDQDLTLESIVHDENYSPKPLLNEFFKD